MCVMHSYLNDKTGGSEGLVGELLKYGGARVLDVLHERLKSVFGRRKVRYFNLEQSIA